MRTEHLAKGITVVTSDDLLARGLSAQLQRLGGVGSPIPTQAIIIEDIDVAGRKLRITHDRTEGTLQIAGVTFALDELPVEVRLGVISATQRLDDAQDASAVASAREKIERLIADLLERRPDLDEAISSTTYADSITETKSAGATLRKSRNGPKFGTELEVAGRRTDVAWDLDAGWLKVSGVKMQISELPEKVGDEFTEAARSFAKLKAGADDTAARARLERALTNIVVTREFDAARRRAR